MLSQPERKFKVGDKIRVNLHHGKTEGAVVRAVIDDKDGLKLQVDFGYEQTALIHAYQVVQDQRYRSRTGGGGRRRRYIDKRLRLVRFRQELQRARLSVGW